MSETPMPEESVSQLSSKIDDHLKSVYGPDYTDLGPDFAADYTLSFATAAKETLDPTFYGSLAAEVLFSAILGDQVVLTLAGVLGDKDKFAILKIVLRTSIENFNKTTSAEYIPASSSDNLTVGTKLKAFSRNNLEFGS